MTARDLVFGAIRRALGVTGAEAPRRKAVEDRLRDHPRGVVPKRGQLGTPERIGLFVSKVEAVSGRTASLPSTSCRRRSRNTSAATICRLRSSAAPIPRLPPCRGTASPR